MFSRRKYQSYNSNSGWNAILPPREPKPALRGSHSVKYLVVGAGVTGLAAARRLGELDKTADILLIDKHVVGENASGRNAGGTTRKVGWGAGREPPANSEEYYNGKGFLWLEEICNRHNIDWQLIRTPTVRATRTDFGRRILSRLAAQAEKDGLEPKYYEDGELHRRIGSKFYNTGLYLDDAYYIQPAALVRGLADTQPSNVSLHENTKMLSFERHGKGWRVQTDGGVIDTEVIVLGVNGFLKEFGYGSSRLISIYTYNSLTELVPEADVGHFGEWKVWSVVNVQRIGASTHRWMADRRFMMRSLHSYEKEMPLDHVRTELTERFHRRFPGLRHIRLEHVWGGLVDMTRNGSPFWGELEPGLWTSTGYNGLGITKGSYLGKRLAECITGADDDVPVAKSYGKATWIPPEPFRKVGFDVIATAALRRAGADTQ